MQPLLFNGKFLSAAPTGVHRVAEELIRATDARLAALPPQHRPAATVLLPRDATRTLPLQVIRPRVIGTHTWQIWEQIDLPRHAGPGLLVNLCNLGPVARRDAVTMIHDAQVWDAPASYSPQFRTWYRALLPQIGHRHRAVLTVSDHARQRLIHHRVAPATAISVIHNGVDHVHHVAPDRGAARAFGLVPGRYVLALATAQVHKNISVLIRAFRTPSLDGLTLALVGGALPPQFRRDVPRNVVALGRISDAALFGLMADAGAYACPSLTEGFGLPPVEAMAMGAPVIAAPCGALPEVLGNAARWAAPDDPSAWAAAIRALTDDATLRHNAIEAGRDRARRFTWDRAAEALLSIILPDAKGTIPCAA